MFVDFLDNPKLLGFKYGFSSRADGSLNRHFELERRQGYFKKQGIDPETLVTADLINGNQVALVKKGQGGQMVANVDALVTTESGLFLSATAADCFLIYLFDPARRVVGILHAGWRGTLAGVVANTISLMVNSCFSSPRDIVALISPGIHACHFEISPEDLEMYANYPEAVAQRAGKTFIDLPVILKRQLTDLGLESQNILDSQECTYCLSDKYYSFRRDKSNPLKVMAGHISCLG